MIEKLKRPKPEPRERCLTPDEWRTLLKGARGPFKVFLWSLLQTGARPSELRSLTWDMYHGDRFILSRHKTSKKARKQRIIYLSDAMQRLVKKLKKKSESPYVFVNTRGEPWTGNAIRLRVDRIKKRYGLASDVCAYLVRHTFGTWMIMNGVDNWQPWGLAPTRSNPAFPTTTYHDIRPFKYTAYAEKQPRSGAVQLQCDT